MTSGNSFSGGPSSRTSGSFSGSSSGFSSCGSASLRASSANLPCSTAISANSSAAESSSEPTSAIAAVQIFLQNLDQLQLGQLLIAIGLCAEPPRPPSLPPSFDLPSPGFFSNAASNCANRNRAASCAALRRAARVAMFKQIGGTRHLLRSSFERQRDTTSVSENFSASSVVSPRKCLLPGQIVNVLNCARDNRPAVARTVLEQLRFL